MLQSLPQLHGIQTCQDVVGIVVRIYDLSSNKSTTNRTSAARALEAPALSSFQFIVMLYYAIKSVLTLLSTKELARKLTDDMTI